MNILDKLVAATKNRVQKDKEAGLPPNIIPVREAFLFENTLHQPNMSFICEVKKASPSKGVLVKEFPYLEIAQEYQAAGATALSVLTEPHYFQGKDRYLTEIREQVSIPLLRKDFIVDAFQIEQSAFLGADAILLICAMLEQGELAAYIKKADQLGLSCLVEAHDESEVKMALTAGARIVGINNRDLTTFHVDTANSTRLRKFIPDDVLFVSESGIRTRKDIELLHKHAVDAVLLGETLMRSSDRKATLATLRGDKCE